MSNHLAIEMVSVALRKILYDVVSKEVNGTDVYTLPPDHSELKSEADILNIFLYQVTPNTAWRNTDLPTRRSDGSLAQRPQLSLNLDYLLTVYGASTKEDPQSHRILGSAMRTLHTRPVLTKETITYVINSFTDPNHALTFSDLADQIELVKFSPITLSLEEMSKLWSVFFQTPYRLSVAYRASVVLIDGKGVPGPAMPVREPNIFVTPFSRPHIESISPQLATLNQPLEINGQNLKNKSVKVVFGKVSVDPDINKIKNKKIEVTLPTELRAGVNTVKVVHELDINQQTGPHKAVESNTAAFMLRPVFKKDPEFSVVTLPDGSTKETIELVIKPKVEKSQQVVLLMNQLNPPTNQAPLAYQFNAPADNGITGSITETDTITFTIKDVDPGIYLIRARVDGAESPLEFDSTLNQYVGPQVTI
jgi:hypothetical protein